MALHENTLDELIERVCRTQLREWKEGTITGTPSTTTFIDSSRNEKDDYFNQTTPASRVHIRTTTDGAAPVGEEREITDWVNSTATGTVSPAFSAAPAAGDTYAILARYTWDEITQAINSAIDMVAKDSLIYKRDEESLELVSDVFEYDVPTGFTHIFRLTMADSDGLFDGAPIPPDQYIIIRGGVHPRIKFLAMPDEMAFQDHSYGQLWRNVDFTAGRKVRVEGFGRQAKLEEDTDICYLNPVFVCAQAGAWLHAARIRRPTNEPDDHREQYRTWQRIADQLKVASSVKIHLPPNCKKVEH